MNVILDLIVALAILAVVGAIVYVIINALDLPPPWKRVATLVLLLLLLLGLIYLLVPLLGSLVA